MKRRSAVSAAWTALIAIGALVTIAVATACHARGPARLRTATALPTASRRPDGIAVDPMSEPPSLRDGGDTAAGILTLREPLSRREAQRTLRAFFDAVTHEDISALALLVLPAATNLDPASRRTTQNLVNLWRERFRKRDYDKLAGHTVYRPAEVDVYRGAQLASLPADVALKPSGSLHADTSDLIARVRLVTASIKSERLFGEDIYFWLRRSGSKFQILRTAEHLPY